MQEDFDSNRFEQYSRKTGLGKKMRSLSIGYGWPLTKKNYRFVSEAGRPESSEWPAKGSPGFGRRVRSPDGCESAVAMAEAWTVKMDWKAISVIDP